MQGICGRGYGRARLDIQTRGDYSKGLTDHVRLSVRCRQNKTGTHVHNAERKVHTAHPAQSARGKYPAVLQVPLAPAALADRPVDGGRGRFLVGLLDFARRNFLQVKGGVYPVKIHDREVRGGRAG